ncbi:MAG: site-specific DNA-methyltransferase [Phycisphaerae bacterium]
MAKKPSSNAPDSKASKKAVVALTHEDAKRKNIPTAEFQPVMAKELQSPIRVAYERRNRDLDPQLVWRGKDDQDWSDLVVPAPPLFIQEKVHPKALIDDLRRQTDAAEIARKLVERKGRPVEEQIDLFADFNGLPDDDAKTEFYQHDAHWANRMILGDSLQVMASLAEREGLRGQVQCIYFDPPYGIKFNSNFQWSTTTQDVKDGKTDHITREPEQVKAFRDTWRDGIHSYLTYLRDRLLVSRDLLNDSGSLFVQIGDENVHLVRAVLDEVFLPENCIAQIAFAKTSGYATNFLTGICDYILWYGKDRRVTKFRAPYADKTRGEAGASKYNRLKLPDGTSRPLLSEEREGDGEIPPDARLWVDDNLTSQGNPLIPFTHHGETFSGTYKTPVGGLSRLGKADRIYVAKGSHRYIRYIDDFAAVPRNSAWMDIGGVQSRADPKIYVVQTATEAVKRCIVMTSDPGDLVLDPTCGSGTTAMVSEQWGRRWITIDTSRVALALARARIMGARYPYYLKADSREGQLKEAEVTRTAPSTSPTHNSLRHGFVYERVPHITLKSIANNAEIDVIWEKFQQRLEPLRGALNKAIGKKWEEWEIPREDGDPWSTTNAELFYTIRSELRRGDDADPTKIRKSLHALNQNLKRSYTEKTLPDRPVDPWPEATTKIHVEWWKERIARQKEIDASIAAKAEFEYLYDKPYDDKKKVRVAGPFTVESLSPHRTLGVDENDDLIDPLAPKDDADAAAAQDFAAMVLENLKAAGVQQADKKDRIAFSSLSPWPGRYICAEGRYAEGESTKEKRAAIFIGPEFGTVSRQDLVVAAREAGDADFDVLIACAFNYEAHASEFNKLGRIPVLKARMNAELHMGSELKTTGKGNLFVIFGEPDIEVLPPEEAPKGAKVKDYTFIRVKINGVDVFHPQTGEVRSDGAEGIACWFIDTDYNEESFFVRQAYFLGANDPYKALKTTLKAEINEEAWATLRSDTSREFAKPKGGKIAVKVINHLGDEVMKVFRVE